MANTKYREYTHEGTLNPSWFLVLVLVVISVLPFAAEAASLTFVSDTLSTSRAGVGADHTIRFTATNLVPASGKIVITPQAGFFTVPSGLDYTDIDLLISGVQNSLGLSPSISQSGVTVEGGVTPRITITLSSSTFIPPASNIIIKIGKNAAHEIIGDQQIVNPSPVGSYKIAVETRNAIDAAIDTAFGMIAIANPVSVGSAAASYRIVGSVVKTGNIALTSTERESLTVFAYQPLGTAPGISAALAPDNSFTFFVTPGTWKIVATGPLLPFPMEAVVSVDNSYLANQPPKGPAFIIDPPSDFVEGNVKDSGGSGLANVSLYAWQEGSPGGGHAMTNAQGYYKMYVPSGANYHVGAYSQEFGFLGETSGVTVSSIQHPVINFTVSSNTFTLSGRITENGVGLAGAFVFITERENGPMVGGGGTDANGDYTARVFGGTDRWIHVGIPAKGEVHKENLGTISASISNKNIAIASGLIRVRISPSGKFEQAFVGAHGILGSGFSDVNVASSTSSFKEYQIKLIRPASGVATYDVKGSIFGYGPLATVSVGLGSDGVFTENSGTANDGIVEYVLSDLFTVSGTVSGATSAGAFVWAASSSGGGGAAVGEDGKYTMRLKNGTYIVGVNKPSYAGNTITVTVSGSDKLGQNLALTAAGQTISGRVYLSDGITSAGNAWVWAENGTGGLSSGTTDGSGSYALNVVNTQDWIVRSAYEGYTSSPKIVAAPASGVNFVLAPIVFFEAKSKTAPVTFSQGGIVQTEHIGVEFPKNVLGQDSNVGTVAIKSTTNFPETSAIKIIGGKAQEIIVRDNLGQVVTGLSGSISMDLTLTKQDVVNGGITFDQLGKLEVSYWDSTANSWIAIPTIVKLNPQAALTLSDLNADQAVTLSGSVDHLSLFAPSLATSVAAPPTPTGFNAVAGDRKATLSWSASAGASKYTIYQKVGSAYQYLAQISQTTHTVLGLTNGTSYSFKVSALDANDNESAATPQVSVTPLAPVQEVVIAAGGGGGGGGGAIASVPYPQEVITGIGMVVIGPTMKGSTILQNIDGSSASVFLDAGSVVQNTEIRITPLAKGTAVSAIPLPSGIDIPGGLVYSLSASAGGIPVTELLKPATVTLRYTDANVFGFNENTLKMYHLIPALNQWVPLESSSVDPIKNTVTAQTKSSSLFAIMGERIISKVRPGDFNNDGKVDLVDFSILLYNWGVPRNSITDINQDGKVDLVDFSILLYWWTG